MYANVSINGINIRDCLMKTISVENVDSSNSSGCRCSLLFIELTFLENKRELQITSVAFYSLDWRE